MELIYWLSNFIIDVVKVVLVLGLLIFIHELGHFLVAKKVGIKVHEFALGFGKKLFSTTRGETTYSLRLFPVGGFVKMEGEEQQSDDERAFNKKPIWARTAVVVAGPLMNILLAVAILFALVLYSGKYVSNQINAVDPKYGAASAGIMAGDNIIRINNRQVRIWDDLNWEMMKNGGKDVKVTVIRGNLVKDFIVKPSLIMNYTTNDKNAVTDIRPESALERLGLKKGDVILSINGAKIESPRQMENVIRQQGQSRLLIGINHNGKYQEQKFDASFVRRYIIGFEPREISGYTGDLFYYSFWKSVFLIKVMVVEIGRLVTGNVPLNQLMGPVGIISEISSREVIADLLWLAAIISLNLGIVNLIPFPPLDGGKILTLAVEAVRRKPIKPENEAMISMVGFSLLILLLIFVTFNDGARLFTGG